MNQGDVSDAFLQQVFQKVDTDRSGSITSNELQAALSNCTWSPFNPETVRMMIGIFDQDHSSTISFDEFKHLWRFVTKWENMFRDFDKDKSGSIDKNEFRSALTSIGYRLSDRFYDLLIKKFDRTGRGTVAFDDFIQACISIQTLTNAFRQHDRLQNGQITINYEDFLTLVFSLKM